MKEATLDTTIEAPEKRDATGQSFRFFTGVCRAYTVKSADGAEDDLFIEGVASSNVRDRYGDTMTAQCQASMLDQSKKLTMFGNHSYKVPEDVFGSCDASRLETNGDVIDLAIAMRIAKSNDRAVKAWQLIHDDKVQLAFSIGGIIKEAEIDEENDDGTAWFPPLIINDLELLEISLVGIPANPRAYTRSFIEDIKKSAFKTAGRDPGVQKAFLRALGVKSLEEEFPDLEAGSASVADLGGEQAEADPADGVLKTCAFDGCEEPAVDLCNLCESHQEIGEAVVESEATRLVGDVTDEAKNLLAEIETRAAALKDECTALDAQITEKKSELETLDAAVKSLREEEARLKATPTGRQTIAQAGGSSATASAPDLSKMTPEQLREHARKVLKGEIVPEIDARLIAS